VAGIYIGGSRIGGFCGRLIPGALGVRGWRGPPGARGPVVLRRCHPGGLRPGKTLSALARLGASGAGRCCGLRNRSCRHLCDGFRRALQLHRGSHLCELPSRRAALSVSSACSARIFVTTWSAPWRAMEGGCCRGSDAGLQTRGSLDAWGLEAGALLGSEQPVAADHSWGWSCAQPRHAVKDDRRTGLRQQDREGRPLVAVSAST